MRAQLGYHRNPQPPPTQERSEPCHTHFLQATHSQKASVSFRQRQVQRGSRSDACTARRSSEPSDTGSVAATPSSPSSPSSTRARLGDDRNPDTLISVGRHTRKGDCTAVSDSRAIGTLSPCDTLISFKRHTRKGSGSVATTPSTTRLSNLGARRTHICHTMPRSTSSQDQV
jgi:hypothetical protein